MSELCYGVWDGVVYDNRAGTGSRGSSLPSFPPDLPTDLFENFQEGNPVDVFLGSRGFLVFSPEADLLWALHRHHERLAAESCGKCTPCRAGAPLLARELGRACRGEAADWHAVRLLAAQMHETALCGVGRTGATALLHALDHFADELKPRAAEQKRGFYSVTTSPCIEACPSHVNVPRYIDYLRDGHNDLAAGVVLRHYPFAGSCGRVCVKYCEQACRRAQVDAPVDIRNLKRFAADATLGAGTLHPTPEQNSKNSRVAVVGAGPVGVTCAYHLLQMGYPVDIYEAGDKAGGMARYGIPFYRLPKTVLEEENALVRDMGALFFYRHKLGQDFHLNDLFSRGYRAIFLATGCPQGGYLGMEGEDTSLPGYQNGIDFLHQVHDDIEAGRQPRLEGDVAVVGGGNVAMDCCRSAARMTSGKVHLIYRRTEADAPADHEEIEGARQEGVEFHFLSGQDALVTENGRITGLRCVRMEQTEPDESGRRGVRPMAGSGFVIPCSHVIAAIGQKVDAGMLIPEDGIRVDRKQHIVVDRWQATSRPGVFAGGDGTSGPRSAGPSVLIHGMAQGAVAAQAIASWLERGEPPFLARERMSDIISHARLLEGDPLCGEEVKPRVTIRELPPDERVHSFAEVESAMDQAEAWKEAERCMRCYRILSLAMRHPLPGLPA